MTSGWGKQLLHCHPEGRGQAGGMGRQTREQLCRKGPVCLTCVDSELNMSTLATIRVNNILGYMNRSTASRPRAGIIPISSAFIRLCQEYCIQVWPTVQEESTKTNWSKFSGEPPGRLGAGVLTMWVEAEGAGLSLQKRQLQGDLRAAPYYLQRGFWEDGARFFIVVCAGRTRGSGHDFKQESFKLDISGKYHSTAKALKQRSKLSRELMPFLSQTFQDKTGYTVSSLVCPHLWGQIID